MPRQSVFFFGTIAAVLSIGWIFIASKFSEILARIGSAPPAPAGSILQAAAAELRAAERLLESLQVVLAAATVFSALFPILAAILAAIYARHWVDERVKEGTKAIVTTELGKTQKRQSAVFYNHLAVVEWRRLHSDEERGLDYAITFASGALPLAEDPDIQATVKSNLSFYWAESGALEKREQALQYSQYARDFFKRNPDDKFQFILANDIFVRMRYAQNCDVKTLQPIADEIRELMAFHSDLESELTKYLAEAKVKCPAVS